MTKYDTHGFDMIERPLKVGKQLVAILTDPKRPHPHFIIETFNRDGSRSKRQIRELYDSVFDSDFDALVAIAKYKIERGLV